MGFKIALGADHGGFSLKEDIKKRLAGSDYEIIDCGAATFDSKDDYPDYAVAVAKSVADGKARRGIMICGSGVGACVSANKIAGVRAGICHDTYSAHQGVEHDDMNVLCLGARIIGIELAMEIVWAFAGAAFSGEPRHQRRLDKLNALEENCRKP